jgi:flagellar hook-basal body complex protein FliE
MAIAPIPAVPIAPVAPMGGAQGPGAGGAGSAGALDFAKGLEAVSQATAEADALGAKVATGELQDIHQFMAAQAKASLSMELTVAVRNKAVEAYQEIMRMQV